MWFVFGLPYGSLDGIDGASGFRQLLGCRAAGAFWIGAVALLAPVACRFLHLRLIRNLHLSRIALRVLVEHGIGVALIVLCVVSFPDVLNALMEFIKRFLIQNCGTP